MPKEKLDLEPVEELDLEPAEELNLEQAPEELLVDQIARKTGAAVSGAAGTITGVGDFAKLVGAQDIGNRISDFGKDIQKRFAPEDPTFGDKVAAAVGSGVTFLVPGLGIAKGAKAVTFIPKLAQFSQLLAIGTSTALEAGIEAGSIYEKNIQQGLSEDEARKKGLSAFIANLPTGYLTNKLGILGKQGSLLRRASTAVIPEGAQEGMQQMISNFFTGEELTKGVAESALVGGASAPFLGALTHVLQGGVLEDIKQKSDKKLPEEPIKPTATPDSKIPDKQIIEQQAKIEKKPVVSEPEPLSDIPKIATEEQVEEFFPEAGDEVREISRAVDQHNQLVEQSIDEVVEDVRDELGIRKEPKKSESGEEALLKKEKPFRPSQETERTPIRPKGVRQIIRQAVGLAPRFEQETVSKEEALKESLKQQEKVSINAYKIGKSEAKAELLKRFKGEAFEADLAADVKNAQLKESFRNKEETVKGIKRSLVDYAKKVLPSEVRGKMLSSVSSAKTTEDLAEAFDRIDKEAQRVRAKGLIGSIKSLVSDITKSETIAVDYKHRLESLLKGIDINNKSDETRKELEATQKFLDARRADGQDVSMPQYVLDKLKVLGQKRAKDLTIPELENLLGDMLIIKKLGRLKLATIRHLRMTQKKSIIKELTELGINVDLSPEIQGEPGVRGTTNEEKFQNFLTRQINRSKEFSLNIAPMDEVMDVLDGGKGFTGPHMKIKKAVDNSWANQRNLYQDSVNPVVDKSVGYGFNKQNFERIGIHAYRVQPDGIEYLLNNGIPIQQIQDLQLTPQENEVYQLMQNTMDSFFPRVKETARVYYNKDVQKRPAYFPVHKDMSKMSQFELHDVVLGEYHGTRSEVQKGFTEKRTGSTQPVNIDAMEIFLKHMDDVTYFVEIGPHTQILGQIFSSPEYIQNNGKLASFTMKGWIDVLSRKGGVSSDKKLPVIDWFRKNLGVAILGFKVPLIPMQFAAAFNAAPFIGAENVAKGFNDVVTDKQWREFIAKNVPEVRERGGDDPAYLEFTDTPVLRDVQKISFYLVQKADVITASAVFSGAYQKSLSERNVSMDFTKPDQEAMDYALLIMRRTQASQFAKDQPLVLSRGRFAAGSEHYSIAKAWLQFRNFSIAQFSLMRHEMIRLGFKGNDPRKGAEILFWLTMQAVAVEGIRRGFRGILYGDDQKKKDLREQVLLELIGNIPFVSDYISMAVYGRSSPIPLVDASGRLVEAVDTAFTGKKPKTREKARRKVAEGAGMLVGLPVKGAFEAIDLLKKLINGK